MRTLRILWRKVKAWALRRELLPSCYQCDEALTVDERRRGKFCFACLPPSKYAEGIRPLGKASGR